ncbi:MAG: LuxR C-terminal-related transcriptional regulator [Planctomycetota bacterium]
MLETNDSQPIPGDFVRDFVDKHSTGLSDRVFEVLPYFLSGLSDRDIAKAVNRSPHTVHAYAKTIFRAFDVNSRSQLLAVAIRHLLEAQQIAESEGGSKSALASNGRDQTVTPTVASSGDKARQLTVEKGNKKRLHC